MLSVKPQFSPNKAVNKQVNSQHAKSMPKEQKLSFGMEILGYNEALFEYEAAQRARSNERPGVEPAPGQTTSEWANQLLAEGDVKYGELQRQAALLKDEDNPFAPTDNLQLFEASELSNITPDNPDSMVFSEQPDIQDELPVAPRTPKKSLIPQIKVNMLTIKPISLDFKGAARASLGLIEQTGNAISQVTTDVREKAGLLKDEARQLIPVARYAVPEYLDRKFANTRPLDYVTEAVVDGTSKLVDQSFIGYQLQRYNQLLSDPENVPPEKVPLFITASNFTNRLNNCESEVERTALIHSDPVMANLLRKPVVQQNKQQLAEAASNAINNFSKIAIKARTPDGKLEVAQLVTQAKMGAESTAELVPDYLIVDNYPESEEVAAILQDPRQKYVHADRILLAQTYNTVKEQMINGGYYDYLLPDDPDQRYEATEQLVFDPAFSEINGRYAQKCTVTTPEVQQEVMRRALHSNFEELNSNILRPNVDPNELAGMLVKAKPVTFVRDTVSNVISRRVSEKLPEVIEEESQLAEQAMLARANNPVNSASTVSIMPNNNNGMVFNPNTII